MNFVKTSATEVGAAGVTVRLPGDVLLTVPVAPGDVRPQTELTLGVRPENIALDGRAGAHMPAEVLVVEHLGSEILVHAKLPDGAVLGVKAFGDTPLLHRGQQMPLGLRPELCYLFTADGAALSSLRPRPINTPRESQRSADPCRLMGSFIELCRFDMIWRSSTQRIVTPRSHRPRPEGPAKRASRRALVASEHPLRSAQGRLSWPFAFDKGRLRTRSVEPNPAIFAACLGVATDVCSVIAPADAPRSLSGFLNSVLSRNA